MPAFCVKPNRSPLGLFRSIPPSAAGSPPARGRGSGFGKSPERRNQRYRDWNSCASGAGPGPAHAASRLQMPPAPILVRYPRQRDRLQEEGRDPGGGNRNSDRRAFTRPAKENQHRRPHAPSAPSRESGPRVPAWTGHETLPVQNQRPGPRRIGHGRRVARFDPGGNHPLAVVAGKRRSRRATESTRNRELPRMALAEVQLCAPVERQEVWAAGVTYLRSKTARMEESDFSATAYDKVYAAERPELFFKSLAEKVVATGEPVGIRRDARWNVPEPELALVLNSRGQDGRPHHRQRHEFARHRRGKSALPAAGKNLPPFLRARPVDSVGRDRSRGARMENPTEIQRAGKSVFAGETSVGQIKRAFRGTGRISFPQPGFPSRRRAVDRHRHGSAGYFTLQERDEIGIEITGIGLLRNPVMVV